MPFVQEEFPIVTLIVLIALPDLLTSRIFVLKQFPLFVITGDFRSDLFFISFRGGLEYFVCPFVSKRYIITSLKDLNLYGTMFISFRR